MIWLLILATHNGGNITLRPVDKFTTLPACMDHAREVQHDQTVNGTFAATMCQQVNGKR